MKIIVKLFLFIIAVFPNAMVLAQSSDSLDIKFIRRLLHEDHNRAQALLDIVRERKMAPEFQIDWVQHDIYCKSKRFSLALKAGEQAFLNDSVQQNTQYFLNMAENMSNSSMENDQYYKAIEYAGYQLERIKNEGLPEYTKRKPFWVIARAYIALGDKKQGYEMADKYIAIEESIISDTTYEALRIGREIYNLTECYTFLINSYCDDNDYQSAYRVGQKQAEIIKRFDNLDQSVFPPHMIEGRKFNNYGQMAYILAKLGRKSEAQVCFDSMSANYFGNTVDGRHYASEYYIASGMYDKAAEVAKENYDRLSELSFKGRQMLDVCRSLAEAYSKTGDYKLSSIYYDKAISISDSIVSDEKRNNALEMATLYDMQDKELRIERQQVQIQKGRTLIFIVVLVAAMCLGVIVFIVNRMIRIRRHNRLMYNQMSEQAEYSHYADERIAQLENLVHSLSGTPVAESAEDRVFSDFLRLMEEENLINDSSLTRDYIVKRLYTNKNKFIAAVQTNTGMNFKDYINNLRLDMVVRQLSESGCDMETIAESCGFNSYRTMSRLFKARFGMSPGQYVEMLKKE